MHSKTVLYLLASAAIIFALGGCGTPSGSAHGNAVTSPVSLSSSQPNARIAVGGVDALDNPSTVGVSLDAALSAISQYVPLPPADSSTIAKVLLNQFTTTKPHFELAIRYTSGVDLYVTDRSENLEADLATLLDGMSTAPFSDGLQHDKLTTVAGKQVLTITGGIQTGRADGWRVPTSASWNQNGYSYTAFSPVTDVSTQATANALSDLLTLVAGTK